MDNASLLTMANGNGWTPEVLARRRQHHGCARLLASFLNDGSAFCAVHSARAMLRRLAGSLEEAAQASRAASAEGATNEDCVMCDICFEDFNTTVQVVPCGCARWYQDEPVFVVMVVNVGQRAKRVDALRSRESLWVVFRFATGTVDCVRDGT